MSAGRVSRGGCSSALARRSPIPGRAGSRRSLSRAGRRERRRRRLAGLVRFSVFLLLIFVAVWAGVRVAHADVDAGVYTGQRYVVEAGDSLWGIAAREYDEGIDPRSAVYEIRAANGLAESALQPGDTLTLPYLGD